MSVENYIFDKLGNLEAVEEAQLSQLEELSKDPDGTRCVWS
jgi:hypothetical protein